MHALPPPEALRSVTNPYLNERMRKRRCFADKDLEMVMMERERQCLEMAVRSRAALSQSNMAAYQAAPGIGVPGIPGGHVSTTASSPVAPINSGRPSEPPSRSLLSNLSPREFLQRIFPTHSASLIELVWQGCGGSLERAIEQLASGIQKDSPAPPCLSPDTPARTFSARNLATSENAGPARAPQQQQQQQLLSMRSAFQQPHPSASALHQQHYHHQLYCQASASAAAAATASGMFDFLSQGNGPPGCSAGRYQSLTTAVVGGGLNGVTSSNSNGRGVPALHPSFCLLPAFPYFSSKPTGHSFAPLPLHVNDSPSFGGVPDTLSSQSRPGKAPCLEKVSDCQRPSPSSVNTFPSPRADSHGAEDLTVKANASYTSRWERARENAFRTTDRGSVASSEPDSPYPLGSTPSSCAGLSVGCGHSISGDELSEGSEGTDAPLPHCGKGQYQSRPPQRDPPALPSFKLSTSEHCSSPSLPALKSSAGRPLVPTEALSVSSSSSSRKPASTESVSALAISPPTVKSRLKFSVEAIIGLA